MNMKRFLALVAVVLTASAVSLAQPRALGIRATYGAELSYQQSLGSNFAEFDLGWSSGYTNFAAVYDIVFSSVDTFKFYAGLGADVCLYDNVTPKGKETVGLGLGVVGQIGVEYQISAIPMNVSLDWRPVFHVVGPTGFGWNSIALGLRYRF